MNRRKLLLKVRLCRQLIACDDAGDPPRDEDAIFDDVYRTVTPAAGVHEVKDALLELEKENRVIRIVGDVVRFSSTARARAFVAENS